MVMRKVFEKIKKKDWRYHKATLQVHSEVGGFAKHFKSNFWTLSISTFGIATGLLWYDVVKSIIDDFFPNRNTLDIKIYVAVIVTLIAITATYVISRLQKKNGS